MIKWQPAERTDVQDGYAANVVNLELRFSWYPLWQRIVLFFHRRRRRLLGLRVGRGGGLAPGGSAHFEKIENLRLLVKFQICIRLIGSAN